MAHRPQNLLPLKKQLEAEGFDVLLEEIEEEDLIEIFMDGKSVLKGGVRSYNSWSPGVTKKTVEKLKGLAEPKKPEGEDGEKPKKEEEKKPEKPEEKKPEEKKAAKAEEKKPEKEAEKPAAKAEEKE
eukprot:RCo036851